MSGEPLFFADGLPSRFENVSFDLFGKRMQIQSLHPAVFPNLNSA